MQRTGSLNNGIPPPRAPVPRADGPFDAPRAWELAWDGMALGQAMPGVPVASVVSTPPQQRA